MYSFLRHVCDDHVIDAYCRGLHYTLISLAVWLLYKTGWDFANFLERWLHYESNYHPITKTKPIYHARNVNRWKGFVVPRPFIGLLILDVINRFIFGHGVVIYYLYFKHFTSEGHPYTIKILTIRWYYSLIWQFIEQTFPFKLSFKNVTSPQNHPTPLLICMFFVITNSFTLEMPHLYKIFSFTPYYSLPYIWLSVAIVLIYAMHFI